jgi:hypothetical protein
MKNIFILSALASLLFACQQPPAPETTPEPAAAVATLDIAAETAALMKVVESETAAFMTKTHEEPLKFWSSAPDISHTFFGAGDVNYQTLGREQFIAASKAFWAANPDYTAGNVTRSNWVWRISPDLAWCRFDALSDTGSKTAEQRVFVRENGEWKILAVMNGAVEGAAKVK